MQNTSVNNNYRRDKENVVTVLLFIALEAIVAWRVWAGLKAVLPWVSSGWYIAAIVLLTLTLPLGFFLPHSKLSRVLDIIGNYWLCVMLLFFSAALFEWLGEILLVYTGLLSGSTYAYVSLAIYSLAAIVTVYGIISARRIWNTSYDCNISKQGPRKLKVVQLSDLHLGSITDLKAVSRIVDRVNCLHPDLICVTGDTFTDSVREVFDLDGIAKALAGLESKYGVYGCLGNHDYGSDQWKMIGFFEAANIRILSDEYVEFDGITLLGRSDMTPAGNMRHKRMDIQECLKGANMDNTVIVMDHQPGDIENTAKAGGDILLSGHTHGGQFFPVQLLVRKAFPHYYGCRKYGNMHSVVSSGTGAAIPHIRLGSKSEIVEVRVGNTISTS